jgi:autotransporter-associated beta strand protein
MNGMKRHLCNFLAPLILLIALSSAVAAQSPADDDAKKTGKITGQVVSDSGQPLADATVVVRAFGSSGPGRSATTDSEGSFQVSGLDPSAYIISALFPTYVPAPRDPDINPIGYYHVGDSVRLEMMKGGVITGTVTRSAGEPVVVVPVRASMVRDSKGQPSRYGAPFREQTTDDRGVYRIYGLPSGTYVVSAGGGSPTEYYVNAYSTDAPTYAPSSTRDTATEVYVRSGEETTNVDIRYRGEPGHVISGIVSGGQGISKNGTGPLVLSGANTFGGGLTVSAGTFSIGKSFEAM